jgi:transcriptional regulator with XRE-family HTH domain
MENNYDIGQRLREAMEEKHMTIRQLADITGISEDSIKAIRSGKTKSPGILLMISIADALDSTMDGLLHRQSLTMDELRLLSKYRRLNSHGKCMVNLMADSENHMQIPDSQLMDESVSTRKIACISSNHLPANNADYTAHATDFIEIPADYFPSADFCLKLTTNLLHPTFMKGDLLAVEKNFPRFGDNGVFLNRDGNELIRQYKEKDGAPYLESISSCDKSTYMTDDIICLGTVLGIVRMEDTSLPVIS